MTRKGIGKRVHQDLPHLMGKNHCLDLLLEMDMLIVNLELIIQNMSTDCLENHLHPKKIDTPLPRSQGDLLPPEKVDKWTQGDHTHQEEKGTTGNLLLEGQGDHPHQ